MPASRLCEHCKEKHAQHATRPYCHGCSRLLGLSVPYRYRKSAEDDPPLGPKPFHRVQAVDQFKTPPRLPPLIQPEAPREITAHGREYVVFWSGGKSLYGSETPRNFGSSLLDSSRIVK